jgi:hypothetical protein
MTAQGSSVNLLVCEAQVARSGGTAVDECTATRSTKLMFAAASCVAELTTALSWLPRPELDLQPAWQLERHRYLSPKQLY